MPDRLKFLRVGRIGAAIGVATAALAISLTGATNASAKTPPPQDQRIITYDTCVIRGYGYVQSGDIAGYECRQQPDGTAILHWW